ncbi:aa737768-7594-4490-abb6-b47df854a3d4 [Thermothielavioides terrestris]|uniref:Aa737768-7594-4490-abb6-b47df854a3d4 n=1 Tax=Thermothielavioides terrestris TaxID=2587410 RepID=A0A446BQB9_9PEZI|nr:aa737768-7594-4490-abb6-b47df854a3d4 [Thermothielavioides terrestris]
MWRQIKGIEVTSEFRGVKFRFVPEGSLASVMSKEAIREELDDDDLPWTPELDCLVNFIHSRAQKLFAITVRYVGLTPLELRKAMKAFMSKRAVPFTDENLPVEPQHDDRDHILASFNENPRRPVWTDLRIDYFCTNQWKFLAPVLKVATSLQYNHDFEEAIILPFVKCYDVGSDRGGFGQVHKYAIHPNHLDDPEKAVRYEHVAIKEIQPRIEKDWQGMVKGWEHEASILQQMNALQQEHIVRFLTAFRHGDEGK